MSQKAKAVNKSRDHDKYSEAAEEISVPTLILAPTSNHHKWKKQILKKLKKDFGPIHEAVVSKCYPLHLRKFSKNCQRSQDYRSREDESTDASDANYSSSD